MVDANVDDIWTERSKSSFAIIISALKVDVMGKLVKPLESSLPFERGFV